MVDIQLIDHFNHLLFKLQISIMIVEVHIHFIVFALFLASFYHVFIIIYFTRMGNIDFILTLFQVSCIFQLTIKLSKYHILFHLQLFKHLLTLLNCPFIHLSIIADYFIHFFLDFLQTPMVFDLFLNKFLFFLAIIFLQQVFYPFLNLANVRDIYYPIFIIDLLFRLF